MSLNRFYGHQQRLINHNGPPSAMTRHSNVLSSRKGFSNLKRVQNNNFNVRGSSLPQIMKYVSKHYPEAYNDPVLRRYIMKLIR